MGPKIIFLYRKKILNSDGLRSKKFFFGRKKIKFFSCLFLILEVFLGSFWPLKDVSKKKNLENKGA